MAVLIDDIFDPEYSARRVSELVGLDPLAVFQKNRNQQTLLHIAAEHGDFQTVKSLIAMGAAINVRDNEDRTPLVAWAMRSFSALDVGRELIAAGADLDAKEKLGFTPLDCVTFLNHGGTSEYVRFLIECGAFVSLNTALHIGMSAYAVDCLSTNPDAIRNSPNRLVPFPNSLFTHAVFGCNEDDDLIQLLAVLLEYGADINGRAEGSLGAVFGEKSVLENTMPVHTDNKRVIEFLIRNGADTSGIHPKQMRRIERFCDESK